MESIILQFRSIDELWAFRIEALIYFIDMDKENYVLTCKCSSAHIELAVKKYKASVVVGNASLDELNTIRTV